MGFGSTTPILRILDEAKARAFYVEYLGFRVDWEHRFEAGLPLYMQVSRDGCVLHLTEHTGDCKPGGAARIQTNELEAFREELAARAGDAAPPEIHATPWGSDDLSVTDPFGNRLTFTTAVTTRPGAPVARALDPAD